MEISEDSFRNASFINKYVLKNYILVDELR